MPAIVTILGYSLISLPYCYFLNRFLVPKYKTYIVVFFHWLSFLLFSAGIYTYLFNDPVLKPILMVLELLIANIVLYKGSILKKIIAVFIILPTSILLELPASFFMTYIANFDAMKLFNSYWLIMVQIISDILLFFAFHLELKLFKDHGYYIKKYAMLFIVICAQFYLLTFSWGEVQFMEFIKASVIEKAQYTLGMAAISFFLDLVLIYLLNRFYQKMKLDITIAKLELEYHKLLDEYMEDRDHEEIQKFLRHDIMNYLIHENIL